jgi:opacity protein-like surface antigen
MSTRLSTHYLRLALISRIGEDWRSSAITSAGDWSGGYFGAIGAAEGNNISTKGAGGSASFSARGGAGGVYAGRNWMYGDAMLGIDGATMLANVSGDGAQPGAASTSYRNFLTGDFRARAGYAFGRFLPYAALGLAFDNAEETDSATGQRQGNIAFISGEVGVGLDYMASERIALRAEYDYAHTLTAISTHLGSETCCQQTRASNSVRLGVAYFFH